MEPQVGFGGGRTWRDLQGMVTSARHWSRDDKTVMETVTPALGEKGAGHPPLRAGSLGIGKANREVLEILFF